MVMKDYFGLRGAETYYKLGPYITNTGKEICFLNFETQSKCDSLSLCWHEPWAS